MSAISSLLRVVIDTNLIVSAFIFKRGNPERLLQALWERQFDAIISDELRAEYQDVLTRRRIVQRYGLDLVVIGEFLALLDTSAIHVGPVSDQHVDVPIRDVKDRRVLATAMAGSADYLITGDNDLLVLADDPRLGNLRIVTVAAFLAAIDAS
jgi:putative PIN family toxin of toxin-antitoxin system